MEDPEPAEEITEAGPDFWAQALDWFASLGAFAQSMWQEFLTYTPLGMAMAVATLLALLYAVWWLLRWPARQAKNKQDERKRKEDKAATAARRKTQAEADAADRKRAEAQAAEEKARADKAEAERAAMAAQMAANQKSNDEKFNALLAKFETSERETASADNREVDEEVLKQAREDILSLAHERPETETALTLLMRDQDEAGFKALSDIVAQDTSAVLQARAEAEDAASIANDKAQKTAQFWIRIGNIAYMNHPQIALETYKQAVELDPSSAHVWNRIGGLSFRLGELSDAETAFSHVLETANGDKQQEAAALGILGLIYEARGDLDEAEEMHKKALALDKELGHKQGMAANYGNLGNIYEARGDLDEACRFWGEALNLFEEVGMRPQVEQVSGLMTDAGCGEDE